MGISDLVGNECRSTMLIRSIEISRHMVHAEKIIEQNLKQVCPDLKKVRSEDGNSSKIRFEVQDKQRFKKKFSNQVPPNALRVNKGKVPNLKPLEGKGGGSYDEKPLCVKCGRKHDGKCLVGTGICYRCRKSCHMKRDCHMMKAQGRENAQAQENAPNLDAPKKLCLSCLVPK